ncbi:MAG: hypothetical protein OXE94_15700 [Aestuariivita sp.]|nr:hypothetical protein [Aestuariivita sp.]MCY4201418.1 hypothetical protein [Aestuariivita sp.]
MADPASRCPDSFAVRTDERIRLSTNLSKAVQDGQRIPQLHAWVVAAEYVCNRLDPERAKAKEREGMGLGL